MYLGNLLDIGELRDLIARKYISYQVHPEFPLAILNYTNQCMFDNYWPDTVQKCRGLVIELAEYSRDIIPESTVIARPFHKFFGLNHEGQTDYDIANLPAVEPTVTEKLDGWFGIMWNYGNNYGVASRGSFTSPGAVFASNKLQKLVKYGAISEFPTGYSPIFEIIFKEGKIVVDYPFEGLVLLGCVKIETGEELPYDDLQAVWAKIAGYAADNRPWIRLAKAHRMSLKDCLAYDKRNFEGFVLTYPRPGTWPIKVKVKLEEYKKLHKLITGITPQQIWKSLHDPMAVWLLENEGIPNHFKTWAADWRNTLMGQFHELLEKAVHASEFYRSNYEGEVPRAVIFEGINRRYPDVGEIGMKLLDGKIYEAYQSIWNKIRPVGRETETFYREGDKE
jgi:RNA ligase